MKKIILLLILFLNITAFAQKPKVNYVQYKKYTTSEKNAINVSDINRVYIVFDGNLNEWQIYKNGSWKNVDTVLTKTEIEALNISITEAQISDFGDYATASDTAALQTQITQNATSITNNTTDIAVLETDRFTQNRVIATNTTRINNHIATDLDTDATNEIQTITSNDNSVNITTNNDDFDLSVTPFDDAALQTQINNNDIDINAILNSQTQQNTAIADNTSKSHEHLNKPILDKFGENANGKPTYNGNNVDTTIAQRDVYDGLDSNNNTISLSAKQGKVLNEKIDNLPETPLSNPNGTPATRSSTDINYMGGNFGIGTTNPTEKLEVNGYSKSNGFKINGKTNAEVNLSGGGSKPISDFALSSDIPTNNNQLINGENYLKVNGDGSQVTNVDAVTLDGYDSSDFTKIKNLTNELQLSNYRKSVIAVVDLTNTNTQANSYSYGKIVFKRSNGSLAQVKINYTAQKKYNSETMQVLYTVSSDYNQVNRIRPCTFIYNGVKYGGFELYFGTAHHHQVIFEGVENGIFGLDYYNTQSNAVINNEVNSSLDYTTNIELLEGYNVNGNEVYHEGNLDITGFVDKTSNENIGGEKTLIEDVILEKNLVIDGSGSINSQYGKITFSDSNLDDDTIGTEIKSQTILLSTGNLSTSVSSDVRVKIDASSINLNEKTIVNDKLGVGLNSPQHEIDVEGTISLSRGDPMALLTPIFEGLEVRVGDGVGLTKIPIVKLEDSVDGGKTEFKGSIQSEIYKSSDGSVGITFNYGLPNGDTLVIKNGLITDIITP